MSAICFSNTALSQVQRPRLNGLAKRELASYCLVGTSFESGAGGFVFRCRGRQFSSPRFQYRVDCSPHTPQEGDRLCFGYDSVISGSPASTYLPSILVSLLSERRHPALAYMRESLFERGDRAPFVVFCERRFFFELRYHLLEASAGASVGACTYATEWVKRACLDLGGQRTRQSSLLRLVPAASCEICPS